MPASTPGQATISGMWPSVFVDGRRRLAPDVLLAEVVAVVGADDDGGVVPEVVAVDRVEHAAEPGVDHRELAAVVGAHLVGLRAR